MLKSLPSMMINDSEFVLNFFNKRSFKPVLLQEAVLVQWPNDLDDLVFTSPTSLIVESSIE